MIETNASKFAAGWFSLLFFYFFAVTESASFDKPHAHQGLVPPYEPKAPKITLNKKALNLLDDGKLYKTQIMDGSSGRGIVVLDVHSSTETVWSRILDYDNYAKMVSGCNSSKNYKVLNHKPTKSNNFQSQTIFTRMKIGISFVNLEYFIKHSYHPKLNALTWTLDYTKTSDLDDSVGYWYIIEHPSKGSSWSRVYYSVDVALPAWLPKFVKDFFSTKALTDATAWVKKESEKEYKKVMSKTPEGTRSVGNDKKTKSKKKGFWKNPWKKKVKQEKEPMKECDPTTAENGSCDASSLDDKGNSQTKQRTKRAFLIFLTFVLFLYNIALFLERVS